MTETSKPLGQRLWEVFDDPERAHCDACDRREHDDSSESCQLIDRLDQGEEPVAEHECPAMISPEALLQQADTLGRDMLQVLLGEVRQLPDVWPKLSKHQQDQIIERLRKQVSQTVQQAVALAIARKRPVAIAKVDKVEFKDGIKAIMVMGQNNPYRHNLADAQGESVVIVIDEPDNYFGPMDEIEGEEDQRAMEL